MLAGRRDEYFYTNKKYSLEELHQQIKKNKNSFQKTLALQLKKKYKLIEIEYDFISEEDIYNIIKEEYPYYDNLTNILLTNPGRQFTASFNPTNYKLSDIYYLHNYNLLHGVLRVVFLIAKFGPFPKYIVFYIFRDYYDSLI